MSEINWRDDAMNEALRGFHNERHSEAAIEAIRRMAPGTSTYEVWSGRENALRFLKLHCTEVKSLLASESVFVNDRGTDQEAVLPFLGWYAFKWQQTELEMVFVPGYESGDILCAGRDETALREFANALSAFAMRPLKRCLRYASGWEDAPELDNEIGKVTWDDITLQQDLLRSVSESVESFFAHKEAMKSFGFSWKRGILLVGPPGTGKTMVSKAAAASLPELPFLYIRDLRERASKDSIRSIFQRARKLAPCILVMEDLDSLINDTNRAVFLNEMDGFQSNDGILIIASSNHPEKIDEALLKRPSRFDRVFHIGLPVLEERQKFCERLLTRDDLADKLAPNFDVAGLCREVAVKTDGFTPAYLKEAFVSAAISRAQLGETVLDNAFAQAVVAQITELKAYLKKVKSPDSLSEMRSSDDNIGFRR